MHVWHKISLKKLGVLYILGMFLFHQVLFAPLLKDLDQTHQALLSNDAKIRILIAKIDKKERVNSFVFKKEIGDIAKKKQLNLIFNSIDQTIQAPLVTFLGITPKNFISYIKPVLALFPIKIQGIKLNLLKKGYRIRLFMVNT